MQFQESVRIDENTLITALKQLDLKVTAGVVTHLAVEFPAGCAGLAHLRILRGGYQVWPVDIGEWFTSDDHVIEIDTHYLLMDHPLQFRIEGYNEDETNYHVLTVRLELTEALDPTLSLIELLERRLPVTTGELIGVLPGIHEQTEALFTLIDKGIIPILQSIDETGKESLEDKYASKPLEEIATI